MFQSSPSGTIRLQPYLSVYDGCRDLRVRVCEGGRETSRAVGATLSWLICISIHHQTAGPTLASLQNKREYAAEPRLTGIDCTSLPPPQIGRKHTHPQHVTAVNYCEGLKWNFDSCLLCTEKQSSAHTEKQSPTLHMSKCHTFKRNKVTVDTNVCHMSTRWPYGHLACTRRKRRSKLFKLETENLPSFLLFSSPLLMLAVCKRCTSD